MRAGTQSQTSQVPCASTRCVLLCAPDVRQPLHVQVMMDFHLCRWPGSLEDDALAQYFDRLNDQRVRRVMEDDSNAPVVTLSHFLPLEVQGFLFDNTTTNAQPSSGAAATQACVARTKSAQG